MGKTLVAAPRAGAVKAVWATEDGISTRGALMGTGNKCTNVHKRHSVWENPQGERRTRLLQLGGVGRDQVGILFPSHTPRQMDCKHPGEETGKRQALGWVYSSAVWCCSHCEIGGAGGYTERPCAKHYVELWRNSGG